MHPKVVTERVRSSSELQREASIEDQARRFRAPGSGGSSGSRRRKPKCQVL